MPATDVGQWVYLSGVYNGSQWLLYRDGVLVATSGSTTQGALQVSNTDWAIGARGTGTERFFQGSIADVSIWRFGRSASQVQADMTSGLTGNEAGLDAYYRFAENSGVTVTDSSGNGNNGILGGMNPAQAPTRVAATVVGTATFNFTPTTVGTYNVIVETFEPDGGIGLVSGPLAVSAAAPAGVDIRGQAANGLVDQPIGGPITVAVVDAYGNTITTSNQLVTLAIASGPAGARLTGMTTVRAVHGIATFSNVMLNVAGTYTLTATGGKLTPDFSNPFAIAPANVTADVKIQRGLSLAVSTHGHTDAVQVLKTVTITNTTGKFLTGPLALVVDELPSGVTLTNATGSYQGSPYVNVLCFGAPLGPGQRITVTLDFLLQGAPQPGDDFNYQLDLFAGI
jgi:hypothetical protein